MKTLLEAIIFSFICFIIIFIAMVNN